MFSWLIRILLLVAGSITGLFVAKDAANFGLVQAVVAMFLIVLFGFVLAFWPTRWSETLDREDEPRGK